MNEITLNGDLFKTRCNQIYKRVGKPLICILGKSSDVQEFNMNSALFHYLLGYEFPETIIIVQENPIVISSPKKAVILQQINGLKIIVKNKDDSNLEAILDIFSGVYGIIDKENIRGDLPAKIFSRVKTEDCTHSILELFLVKEKEEMDFMVKSGIVANYLLNKAIDLIRDDEFSKEELENYMEDRIAGINNNLIEYSFDPEFSSNHIRLGIRYRGYCTEIARRFLTDLTEEYEIQSHFISLLKPGVSSVSVLKGVKDFIASKRYTKTVSIYTLGLIQKELDFETDFTLQNNMCCCLNIDNVFCNSFTIDGIPIFLTKKDSKEDYSSTRMRFRNKSNDAALVARIKEHQKELLETLIEEKLDFLKTNQITDVSEAKESKTIPTYQKDSSVPRSEKISFDWDLFYILVPILSYSVPFHITTIKNVSIVTIKDEPRLRINFKDSKEIKDTVGQTKEHDTKIKFITLRCSNVEDVLNQINDMKKEYNKPKLNLPSQPVLKEKFKKYALTDLYMRTDNKATNKKTLGNLELHENGFKYNDVQILFSNIKNIFLQMGDLENRAIIHFNLKQPILHIKPTYNVQFFRKFNVSYHDTSKKEDERLELIHEKEEEEEIQQINSQFFNFVERIEHETNLKVQIPERGFLGVHSKEAVFFYLTNECIVSINDIPFFSINLDEVEIVSLERVTFITKTFDCVFIFKDLTRTPVVVGSIENTKLNYLKEVFDSHNIIFMENKVNINWNNLLPTITADPVNFYENGAWAELLREADDSEDNEVEDSSSSAYSYSEESDEEDDDDTTYDTEEEISENSDSSYEDGSDYSSEDDDDDSDAEEDTEEDSYSSSSSESFKNKKRKR